MRTAVLAPIGAVLAFAAVTVVALEGREVVVVRTFDEHGQARGTRTWVADDGAYAWIEAANGERLFLRQLQQNPAVELERGGQVERCQAQVVPNPEGHEQVRQLLAQKYGWADRWIGYLVDTSGSVAVRLACK